MTKAEFYSKSRLQLLAALGLFFLLLKPFEMRAEFASSHLDLSQLRIEGEVFKLSGPWDFYWGELLVPQQVSTAQALIMPRIRPWNHMAGEGFPKFPAKGLATYRMSLIGLSAHPRGYYLSIPGQVGARRLIVTEGEDFKVLADYNTGHIDPNGGRDALRDIMLPIFPSGNKRVDITIQTQTFGGPYGGFIFSPQISLGDGVLSRQMMFLSVDLFALTVGILVGVYNLTVWFMRPRDKAALYLALAAFMMILRILGTSYVFRQMFSEEAFEILRKCEYLPICLAPYFIFLFLQRTFPVGAHSQVIEQILKFLVVVFTLTVLNLTYTVYSEILLAFQVFSLLLAAMSSYILLRAFFRKQPDIHIALFGYSLLFGVLVWDIVFVFILSWVDLQAVPFGVSMFFIVQSYLIMIRTERMAQAARELAEQNADIQKNLLFETEERLILAATVAHNINNPLNYIQTSKESLSLDLSQYNDLLHSLLGEEDPNQPDLYRVQLSVKALGLQALAAMETMDNGLKRASKAVRDIRILSGIDGNPVSDIVLEQLMTTLLQRLGEVESQLQLARIQYRSRLLKESKIIGNEALLIHALEFVMALALEHGREELVLYDSQPKDNSYRLLISGILKISEGEQELALKRLNHILHSSSYLFELRFGEESWSIEVTPVIEENEGVD